MPAPSSTRRRDPPGADRARVVIRLLGEPSTTVDGQRRPELIGRRTQRLLARVALAGDAGVPRDRLACELWPDSSTTQARTNLRKLLHDLRRALPCDVLDTGGRAVRWSGGASAWLDVRAFTDAVGGGDPEGAVRCYGGDLLPACEDDWTVAVRERLRRLAVEVLAGLAARAGAEHDPAVLRHARRLLAIDALHEPACRLLMDALDRRGERSEALRVFDRLAAGLARDLGVTPEPATTAIAERLRGPGHDAHRGPVLVGREAELRAADAAWRAAAGGRARLLLVTGEAGIGKSRLVEELARRVAADGHAVAYGRAYEAAGRPPWGPVIDWLRSDAVQAGLDALGDARLTELARLLPELRTAHPRLPDVPPAGDVGRRHRLLDAVRRGLLASRRSLLLVVDDLQWCDSDTLELCGHLVQSSPSAPVLIAGTVRVEDAAGARAWAMLHGSLAPCGAVSTIALGPLDPAATAEMAALVERRALPADAAARLWHETEGNPLFVLEALRAGFAGSRTGRIALTPTVHAVITARLDRLSPGARRLAEVAATIGREFSTAVLATAAGRPEDDLTADLDELWEHHVVRERGPAYDFTHDRLREVALELISPARRRTLHRRVAEAIEAHHAADLDPVSARLAVHYADAGLDARAVEAYERAARHAHRVFALDDCIALLERALRMLDESPRGTARDEVELRLRSALGVPLVARRGYGAAEVLHCYERVLTLHRKLGRRPGPAVLRGLALHAVATLRLDRAAELGRELLVADRADRTSRTEGEYVLGVTAFWRGEFAAAEGHLRDAIGHYRLEDAPLHVARYAQDPLGVCLSRLALTHLFRGRPADADATMREALRVAAELDDPMTTGYVRGFDAILAALEPGLRDLDAAVDALETVTRTMHIGYFAIVARLLQGWRDVRGGDPHGVVSMENAIERFRAEQPLHLTLALCLLARAHLLVGDVAAARPALSEGLGLTEDSGQRYLLPELLRVDAEVRALAGDRAGAARSARRAVESADALDAPWLRDRAAATRRNL